jgi:hypothetical protein
VHDNSDFPFIRQNLCERSRGDPPGFDIVRRNVAEKVLRIEAGIEYRDWNTCGDGSIHTGYERLALRCRNRDSVYSLSDHGIQNLHLPRVISFRRRAIPEDLDAELLSRRKRTLLHGQPEDM